MTYRGRVKNGVIVLDPPATLQEGEQVEVVSLRNSGARGDTAPVPEDSPRTLYDVFRNVIGKAEGLPEDSSINHDHYLYGSPKR